MDKKIIIGRWEVTTILINMICTKIFLNFPRKMAEEAGTAGWILSIYISLLAFIGFFIIVKLYRHFEGKDLLDIGEHIGGEIGRIAIGAVLLAFLLYITSLYVREFTEDMKIVALNVSPISYVTVFFIVCMMIGAYLGLEAIARYHAILVPIIATGYLIIIFGVLKYFDGTNLLPVLGFGADKLFWEGALKVSVFSELVFIALLAPFIKTHKNLRKSGFMALGLSSFFLIVAATAYLAVIPMPGALEKVLPIYHLARLIDIGRFFQRIESVFVIIWALAGLLYVTVGFYFVIHVFRKMFRLKYFKPLILPFASLIFALSLFPKSLLEASFLESEVILEWGWVMPFAFVTLLLLLARMIKRKDKKQKSGI